MMLTKFVDGEQRLAHPRDSVKDDTIDGGMNCRAVSKKKHVCPSSVLYQTTRGR